MSLRIRRGTNTERTTQYFDNAEPVWVTDSQKLYIGDGQSNENGTQGGINILASSAGEGLQFNHTTQQLDLNFADPRVDTDDLSEGSVNRYFTDQRARASAASLIMNGTSPNITYTLTTDPQSGAEVLNTFIDFGAANIEGIQDTVADMFQQAGNIDILFSYDDSAGEITATLDASRIRYYAESVITEGNQTGLSLVYDSYNNVINSSIDNLYIQDLVTYTIVNGSQSDVTSITNQDGFIDLSLNTSKVKDIASEMFTDPAIVHQNITFTYADGKITASASTQLIGDTTPSLGGNLNLNNFDVEGTGNIKTTGYIQLSALDEDPGLLSGAIALATGINWNPAGYGGFQLVYNDGANWYKLGAYERTRTIFVDASRSNYTYSDGTIMFPYSSISAAISAANLTIYDPAFIILMSDVNENIIISKNINISGITFGDSNNSVKLIGTVTFDFDAAAIGMTNYASISNLKIVAPSNSNAVDFVGVESQEVTLKNVTIEGRIHLNNSGTSVLTIKDSYISNSNVTEDSVIKVQTGKLNVQNSSVTGSTVAILSYASTIVDVTGSMLSVDALSVIESDGGITTVNHSTIKNIMINSNGLKLVSAGTVANVINTTFDVVDGSGKAVFGIDGTIFTFNNDVFLYNTNNQISTEIDTGIITLSTTFTPTLNPVTP